MKNLLTLFVLFLGLGMANAQEKKELTIEETVTYLNKKLDEVEEQWIVENNGSKQFITGLYIESKESELKIRDFRQSKTSNSSSNCGDWYKEQYYDFKPIQISEISDLPLTNVQSLGYLQIKLTAKTAKCHLLFSRVETRATDDYQCNWRRPINDDREFCDYIYIPYLKSDPANFNKLKKAFEHLKKLSAASDDPF